MWHDLRHAARSLRRSPGFTIAAVLTLGIGATTAVFSVVDDRLVAVFGTSPEAPKNSLSCANFVIALSCLTVARRAAPIDPVVALRQE